MVGSERMFVTQANPFFRNIASRRCRGPPSRQEAAEAQARVDGLQLDQHIQQHAVAEIDLEIVGCGGAASLSGS